MEVMSQSGGSEGGANTSLDQSECVTSQPISNGMLPQHAEPHTEEAPPPCSDRTEDGGNSDDFLTDSTSTNDVSRLIPDNVPSTHPLRQKDRPEGVQSLPLCTPPPPSLPPSSAALQNGSVTSSSPPSTSCNANSSLHRPCHHHHATTNQKRLSSTKSHAPLKTDAAHIKEVAGDACGGGGVICCEAIGCCCCVEAAGGVACTEDVCQAVLDCGIVEDCCGSSDCLEICLECCSICFPA
ncbi:uncharacterized protein ACJ7VT_013387 isoform 2-T3 [Polymixia lowei]